jgi:hypothetical protein
LPQIINLIEIVNGENYSQYILVAYKSKFEIISEKTGDCLQQFQFCSMSTIRSIVELYDKEKLELLVTHNSNRLFFINFLNMHQLEKKNPIYKKVHPSLLN